MEENICNICGSVDLILKDNRWKCDSCGAMIASKTSSEEKTLLISAWKEMRNASFDSAENSFSDIISKFPTCSDAYWGLVLARYGIKYEDDFDDKKIPTVYATKIESFLSDKDYLKAVKLCNDEKTKNFYLMQAKLIEKLRIEWVEKAKKEKPFDIFLCFKDSDKIHNIERTKDSEEVANLYVHLSQLGYRVFFSRESLRGKTADRFEPYIFNAIQTASVMIVYGSSAEYFTSTWMKNEWTRYFKQIREGSKESNSLLTVVDNVEPSYLPNPLNKMQCMDARKKTFYGDLEKHIKKIILRKKESKIERIDISTKMPHKNVEYVVDNTIEMIELSDNNNIEKKLTKRLVAETNMIDIAKQSDFTATDEDMFSSGIQMLEAKAYDEAKIFFDRCISINPQNGKAWLGLYCTEKNDFSLYTAINTGTKRILKITDTRDLIILRKAIEYAANTKIAEYIISNIVHNVKSMLSKKEFDLANNTLLSVIAYKSNVVEKFKLKITESGNFNENTLDIILKYTQDVDDYIRILINICQIFVNENNGASFEKYSKLLLEVDKNNIELVRLKIDDLLKNKTNEKISNYLNKDLATNLKELSKEDSEYIIGYLCKTQLDFLQANECVLAQIIFQFVIKYNFNSRQKFINENFKRLDVIAKNGLFDFAKSVFSSMQTNDVDLYIKTLNSMAVNLLRNKDFDEVKRITKDVLTIHDGNVDATMCDLFCSINFDLESYEDINWNNFNLLKFEKLLECCEDEPQQAQIVEKFCNMCLNTLLENKKNALQAEIVLEQLIKYFRDEDKKSLIDILNVMVVDMMSKYKFALAFKYINYIKAVEDIKNNHKLHYILLLISLECKDKKEFLLSDKFSKELPEYQALLLSTNSEKEAGKEYVALANENLALQIKREESRIRKEKKIANEKIKAAKLAEEQRVQKAKQEEFERSIKLEREEQERKRREAEIKKAEEKDKKFVTNFFMGFILIVLFIIMAVTD